MDKYCSIYAKKSLKMIICPFSMFKYMNFYPKQISNAMLLKYKFINIAVG